MNTALPIGLIIASLPLVQPASDAQVAENPTRAGRVYPTLADVHYGGLGRQGIDFWKDRHGRVPMSLFVALGVAFPPGIPQTRNLIVLVVMAARNGVAIMDDRCGESTQD